MLTFYDSENQPHVLGEQLGRGGEGTVFSLSEDLTVVAKIYHEPIEEEKAEKLRWMARNKDEKLSKVAAWVIDVLYDQPDGKVVGFLMPSIRAKEIHELYSLKSRRVYFPEATWHFLVHTAANVARAFYALHKNDHVMGDVNHGNCVVLADGTVKLIDCDSYSVKKEDFRYRCEVGVATHLAPELQNADLGEVEREANHDNFGLAVIIFQLLFLGRHPFAGNYTGAEDKSLEECIAEHRFAYGAKAESYQVRQPPGTLSLAQVSPRVAELFERAFSPENINRPAAREWIEALEDLSDNLEQCAFHPGHYYFKNSASCPWCAIESKTGVMLFPFISSAKSDDEKQFNIFTIENLISNLGISTDLPARPLKPEILPVPTPQIVEAQKSSKKWQYAIIGAHFVALTFLMAVFGVGVSCFLGFLLMALFITILNNTDKNLRGEINDRLEAAQKDWEKVESEWGQAIAPKKLADDLSQIKTRITDYQNFQTNSVQQLKSIGEKHRARSFEAFSSDYKISNVRIPGFENSHVSALNDRGIKTAADLTEENLSHVFILRHDAKENLLKWRAELEKNYRANNDKKHESEKQIFTQNIAEKRRTMEREIEFLLASLRSGSLAVRQRQQGIVSRSEKAALELVQAESDVEVVGTNSFAVLALLLITFVMPFIGILLSEVSTPNAPPPAYKPGAPRAREFSGEKNVAEARSGAEVLSDSEIAGMSATTRNSYAEELHRQAVKARTTDRDLPVAEKKLRLAMRLKPGDVVLQNEMGILLHDFGKYDESLTFLKRSLILDEDNPATKTYIGMNYIMLNRYTDAVKTLKEATNDDPNSYDAFYNLGQAYEGLENYSAAVTAFRRASKINSGDARLDYELGYCFYKLGNTRALRDTYLVLLGKDPALAGRLKDVTGIK